MTIQDFDREFDSSLQRVLNALANACLAFGRSYADFDAASRAAFVGAATRPAPPDRPLNDASVSFITGLKTAEVYVLRSGERTTAHERGSPAARLIEIWLSEHVDADGRPNPLPVDGPVSVAALLERVQPQIDIRDALAALAVLGVVRRRRDSHEDYVVLNERVLPDSTKAERACSLYAGAYPLLAAISGVPTANDPVVRTASVRRVAAADAERLQAIAAGQLEEAQTEVSSLFDAYGATREANDVEQETTVTSGVFLVASGAFKA